MSSRRATSTGEKVLHEERRRAQSTSVLCEASLACPGCDAPVWPGETPVSVAEALRCPFCAHAAPARDFLSLAQPTRPARVVVRLSLRSPAARRPRRATPQI